MTYQPAPIDTTRVRLNAEVEQLTELLSRNAHDVWARQRLAEGWRHGPRRDDNRKEHPGLVPYDQLPESERVFDRNTAMETIRVILALGFRIVPPGAEADA